MSDKSLALTYGEVRNGAETYINMEHQKDLLPGDF